MPDHNQPPALSAMRSEAMFVSPDRAQRWLAANIDNRPLGANLVREYAGAMRRGEWKLSPQGVTFSSSGRLLDGQHRLAAVVSSGVPVWLYVTYGAADEVFAVMDQGKRRSYADISGLPKRVAEMRGFLARQSIKSFGTVPSVAQIDMVPHCLNPIAAALVEQAPFPRKSVGSAPSLAAVTLRALNGEREWVFSTYKAMINLDFANLDPAPLSFLKQCIDGHAGRPTELFARAWTTFDYAGRTRQRIVIKDAGAAWLEAADQLAALTASAAS